MPSIAQVDKEVYVSGQLQEQDIAELAGQGVKTIINNRPDGESWDQPTSEQVSAAAAKHGMGYHYIPIGREPLTMEKVDEFARVLAEAPRPIVAFCRSGARSNTLFSYASARLMEQRIAASRGA